MAKAKKKSRPFCSNTQAQEIVSQIFEMLENAGVRPGDTDALSTILRRIVRVGLVHRVYGRIPSDPHEAQASEANLVVTAWNLGHGLIEIHEPPPEVRRAGAAERILGKPVRMMRL